MSRRTTHAARTRRTTATARSAAGRRKAGLWLPVAALLLLGSLVYANSLDGVFVIDDFVTIVRNPDIRSPWSTAILRAPFGESAVLGRPLAAMTLAINYALHGLDARGYHVVNIAVHLLCTLVLFGIIRRAGQTTAFAFACASLWMVHPLNSEVVTYISQRTESLMALFYLLTIYASVRAHASPHPKRWLIASVVASSVGAFAKQSMITIGAALLLIDYALYYDSLWSALRSRWRLYVAVAVASWMTVLVTVLISPSSSAVGWASGSEWLYFLNQSVVLTHYLTLTVWPHKLVADYGYPVPYTLLDVLPQMALIGVLLAITGVALRYRPKVGFLGAWCFLTLGMTSSVAPIATQIGAERRMYLPLAALVILGVLAARRAAQYLAEHTKLSARFAAIAGVVLWAGAATALSARTVARNRDYSSALRLAEVTFDHWPSGATRTGLADELLLVGRRTEAIALLRAAVRDDPRAHFALGRALFEDDHLSEAREHLETFVRLRPKLFEVLEARTITGRILIAERRYDEAAEQFRRVLEMKPSAFDGHLGLAEVLMAQGRYADAVAEFRAYYARGGGNPAVRARFGVALAQAGHTDEAIEMLERAVDQTDAPDAHRALAAILLERRDIATAFRHAARAAAVDPADSATRALLGVVLAAQGRLDLAAVQFREALRMNPGNVTAQEHLDQVLAQ